MRPTIPRRFTVADGVILIAATAISIWVSRTELIPWSYALFSIERDTWAKDPVRLVCHWGSHILRHTQPAATIPTLALLAMRLTHPRPSIRRLCKQPGFTAVFAASVAIFIGGAFYNSTSMTFNPQIPWEVFLSHVASMPRGSEPGIAVAVAWLLLALERRWRPEPSWIDRFGRLVGGYWLVMALVAPFAPQR